MSITRGGICDNRCQSFHKQMIENEDRLRIRWFQMNQEKLLSNAEGIKSLRQRKITTAKTEQTDRVKGRKLANLPPWKPPEVDRSVDADIMKPIDAETNAILYQDKIQSFLNSKNYFSRRCKTAPEDRYYLLECTSWVYGWRLSDFPPISPSAVGKKQTLRNEIYHPKEYNLRGEPKWSRGCQAKEAKNFREWIL